jgi:hypothetical protein
MIFESALAMPLGVLKIKNNYRKNSISSKIKQYIEAK